MYLRGIFIAGLIFFLQKTLKFLHYGRQKLMSKIVTRIRHFDKLSEQENIASYTR